jgi:hypothetical protein
MSLWDLARRFTRIPPGPLGSRPPSKRLIVVNSSRQRSPQAKNGDGSTCTKQRSLLKREIFLTSFQEYLANRGAAQIGSDGRCCHSCPRSSCTRRILQVPIFGSREPETGEVDLTPRSSTMGPVQIVGRYQETLPWQICSRHFLLVVQSPVRGE